MFNRLALIGFGLIGGSIAARRARTGACRPNRHHRRASPKTRATGRRARLVDHAWS